MLITCASTNHEIRLRVTSTANVCHWLSVRFSRLRATYRLSGRVWMKWVAFFCPGVYAVSATLRAPHSFGRSPAGTSSMSTRYGVLRCTYWRCRIRVSQRPTARPLVISVAVSVPGRSVRSVSIPCWLPTEPGPWARHRDRSSGPTNL